MRDPREGGREHLEEDVSAKRWSTDCTSEGGEIEYLDGEPSGEEGTLSTCTDGGVKGNMKGIAGRGRTSRGGEGTPDWEGNSMLAYRRLG